VGDRTGLSAFPIGVTATFTLTPSKISFKLATFHSFTAFQSEAPPRMTNGLFCATKRRNSSGEGRVVSVVIVEGFREL